MESIPFRVERVDVYAEGTSSALYEQKRTELSHLLNHPGWKEAKGKPRDAQLIVGGEQVIDFLWMVVPSGSPPPKTLLHTITLRRINTQASITLPIGSVDVIGQAVMIDPPLRGGSWAALNGPSASSQHRQSTDSFNGKTDFAERFAIDWVKVDENGQTAHGDRLNLKITFAMGSAFMRLLMQP